MVRAARVGDQSNRNHRHPDADSRVSDLEEVVASLRRRVAALEAVTHTHDPDGPPDDVQVVTAPTGVLRITTPGEAFESVRFECRVVVLAAGVSFTGCRFVGTPGPAPVESALLAVPPGGTVTATDCTFSPQASSEDLVAVQGSGFTLTGCTIAGTAHGVVVRGPAGATLTGCTVRALVRRTTRESNAGVRVVSGSPVTIQGCTFTRTHGWGVQVQQLGTVAGLTIDGCTFGTVDHAAVSITDGRVGIVGITLTGNTFPAGVTAMLVSSSSFFGVVHSGNVWDDASVPAPIPEQLVALPSI